MSFYQIIVVIAGTSVLVIVLEDKLVGLVIGLSYGALMHLGGNRRDKSSQPK